MLKVLKPVYQELEIGGAEEAAYRRHSGSIFKPKKVYDYCMDMAREMDQGKTTIQYQLTQGINTFKYEDLIKLIYQFERNEIQKSFPSLDFSNINDSEISIGGRKLNKTLSFEVTGYREQLRIFHRSILYTDFDKEFPLHIEKANFNVNEIVKISILKKDFNKLEEDLKVVSNMLSKTTININHDKSNYSSLFNSFSKKCDIFLDIKGVQCEYKFLIEDLSKNYSITLF